MKKDILNEVSKKDTTQLIVVKYKEGMNIAPIVEYTMTDNKHSYIYFKYTAKKDINAKLQLKQFMEAIHNSFTIETMRAIKHWNDAFIYLKRVLAQKMEENKDHTKVVIFLDEVSRFDDNKGTDFLSTFGYFYNTFCQKNKSFLIILGSSDIVWVDDKLRKDIGSLYQRFDEIMSIE